MDNTQIRYVFDNKKQASDTKKGLLTVEVRITGTNKRKTISTGIKLYKNQFSDKNGFTCRNHSNAPAITGKATRIFRQIEAFILSDECKNLDDVKNWNKEHAQTHSVSEFIRDYLRKSNPSLNVVEYHNSFLRRLDDFGKIKVFADCTYQNIEDFDFYLKEFIKSQPTLYKRHSLFKRYIEKAIKKGLCKYNPYDDFETKKGKSKEPVFLVENEIEKILNYEPVNEKLHKVKDLFVFQIFTGVAYVDLQNFDKSYISEIDGKEVISSNRKKTDQSFISLLLPEAKKVLEKYDFQLPKISNQKYNDYLKILIAGAGINKMITSHTARHTYATYLLNKGISITTVSRALGHSSERMTAHYAKLLGKTVVSEMSVLLK